MARHWVTIAARAAAALALTVAIAAEAAALDAFWHGVRSANWSHGVQRGVSNWYSEPPAVGQPLAVPDEIALFAQGALRTRVNITEQTVIETFIFLRNVEPYRFNVRAELSISGAGIENVAGTTPSFVVDPNGAILFIGWARLRNLGNAENVARFTNRGLIRFTGQSRGGNAAVTNKGDGILEFRADSAAVEMTIVNEEGGRTIFRNRSSPELATILNKAGGRLFLHFTQGFGSDGQISARSIDNRGLFRLGSNSLRVTEDFVQTRNGGLALDAVAENGREGRITARNVDLDGALVVSGPSQPLRSRFILIRAHEQLFGHFAEVQIRGIDPARNPRIVYRTNRVLLLLD